MRAFDVIYRKRMGAELSREEIEFLVGGFVRGEIPDYQVSAFLMAVCIRGMSDRETADLTLTMAKSGDMVDLGAIPGVKVDKHSTGGVGDKTTLALIPMVAACGAPVAKMSGRGLGHTGGTVDKLESFRGWRSEMTRQAFIDQVNRIGCAVAGQSGNLVPADKLIYALRDVTATVDSIPLIASSVMSKKIAGGADAIVLDVKAGSGAFMQALDDAIALARAMVAIGSQVGRQTVAFVTDMDEPLGSAIGHAVEVEEAMATLRGEGLQDLTRLCLHLGSEMLRLAGIVSTPQEGEERLRAAIDSGAAYEKLRQMVTAQGGDFDAPLPRAPLRLPVPAPGTGYVQAVDAMAVGLAVAAMGGGRARKEDAIDLGVGALLHAKVGSRVQAGEPLATVLAPDEARGNEAVQRIAAAFRLGRPAPPERPLILAAVTADGQRRIP